MSEEQRTNLTANISKAAASLALNLALDQLDQRVKELRPFTPHLRQQIGYALTFQPPEAADKITEAIAALPADYHDLVLQTIREYLHEAGTDVDDGVVASGDSIYGNRLLHALPKQ